VTSALTEHSGLATSQSVSNHEVNRSETVIFVTAAVVAVVFLVRSL